MLTMRAGVFALSMMLLAGCLGTPELPLLSEVDLAEDAPTSDLAATDTKAPETVLKELQSVEKLPVIETSPTAKSEKPRRGLFGMRRPKNPPVNQTEPGTQLPYGEIGVACGIRGKAMGKQVDRFPAKGKGYRLYDSDPSSAQLRTHYLTGFSDGCPRQFTVSLVLLASPMMHEQLLVAEKNHKQHSNAADKAFEKIRRKICRVGRGKPCPENRVAAMEKSMAFVTTYEHFGDNARWEEILLHKGEVAANSNPAR